MQIKKSVVTSLVERLNAIDKVSRRKTLSAEEQTLLAVEAVKAVRSTLSVLRKLK